MQNCWGCCPILVGVELICLFTLVTNIFMIAICSSAVPKRVFSLSIAPHFQVLAAAWAFIGIPITVTAGIGALYKIEQTLKLFFGYLVASLFIGTTIPIGIFSSGSTCVLAVKSDIWFLSPKLFCDLSDIFFLMVTLIVGTTYVYNLYIIWSAAEMVAKLPFPRVVKHSEVPDPMGPLPPKVTNQTYKRAVRSTLDGPSPPSPIAKLDALGQGRVNRHQGPPSIRGYQPLSTNRVSTVADDVNSRNHATNVWIPGNDAACWFPGPHSAFSH